MKEHYRTSPLTLTVRDVIADCAGSHGGKLQYVFVCVCGCVQEGSHSVQATVVVCAILPRHFQVNSN